MRQRYSGLRYRINSYLIGWLTKMARKSNIKTFRPSCIARNYIGVSPNFSPSGTYSCVYKGFLFRSSRYEIISWPLIFYYFLFNIYLRYILLVIITLCMGCVGSKIGIAVRAILGGGNLSTSANQIWIQWNNSPIKILFRRHCHASVWTLTFPQGVGAKVY